MTANTRLTDYLDLVRRRKALFLGVLVGFIGLVMVVTYRVVPVYESTVTVMIEANALSSRFSLMTAQPFSRQAIAINNDIEVLTSRRLIGDVVARLDREGGLEQFERLRAHGSDPTEWLRRSMNVRLIKATDVIELTASAGDPHEAKLIANTIAAVYIDHSRQEAQSRDTRLKQFLAEQVEQARDRLSVTEMRLKDFQEEHRVASIDGETKAAIKQLAEFDAMLRTNEVELDSQRQRLHLLSERRRTAAGNLETANAQVSGPLSSALRTELAGVMAIYARFQAAGYDAGHEKMQELEHRIQMFQKRLAAEARLLTGDDENTGDPVIKLDRLTEQTIAVRVEIATLEARSQALRAVVEDYQHELDELPAKAHQLAQLSRAAEVEEAILVMLHKRYEESRIEEAAVQSRGRVIDPAVAPVKPVRPRPLLSLILGVVFGIGLAFGACVVSRPLQRYVDSSDMVQRLTGLKILGRIPIIADDQAEARSHSRLVRRFLGNDARTIHRESSLVLSHGHGSEVVEAYRALRTMLQFSTQGDAPRTILVTSAGPGDGKTTTAANLAVTFAASGERVLLVDADMRKPKIHHLFGLHLEGGLREVLTGESRYDEALHRSTVADLDILTAGTATHNPAELLGSRGMTELIQGLREEYRYVIFDSPPVLPVTDPAILSTRVDTTVFVVRDGATPKAALEYGINVLRCLPIQLAGVVYNQDHSESSGDSYRYGYGYGQSYRRSDRDGESSGKWISEGNLPGSRSREDQEQEHEQEQEKVA